MKRHLFLTGAKQVGKSTLIEKFLSNFPGQVGGFRTVRTNALDGLHFCVHLLGPKNRVPTRENLVFSCEMPPDEEVKKRFDRLGCAALQDSQGADLLLMDELGPHEVQAEAFQKAVLQALDGPIPVLGVLQMTPSPFLRQIAQREDVTVLTVTPENRDTLDLTKFLP